MSRPRAVVVDDDKVSNVRDMERPLAGAGVAVRCFRYAATDEKVRAFQRDARTSYLPVHGTSRLPSVL